MKILLRSPLHGIMSKNTLLVTFIGWKSGNVYTTPTNYSQDGEIIRIVSFRYRVWWQNLVGKAPVTLRLRGEDVRGDADVLTDDRSVAQGLRAYLQPMLSFSKYFDIDLDENGQLITEDIHEAAKTRVIVEVTVDRE
jgi:hypothetical protein